MEKEKALIAWCNLIGNRGVEYARQQSALFLEIAEKATNRIISEEQRGKVFKIFSFLNWAYANGVWSNLANTKMRRDLMRQSMMSFVLATSYELSEDKSQSSIAFLAVDIDREFRQFAKAYMNRIKELAKERRDADANTATLIALEWLQTELGLNDIHMGVIVPQFANQAGDIAQIEELAKQVNIAASRRAKLSFLSRLFRSR